MVDFIHAAELLAKSGFAALIITIGVALWQTRELRACRERDARCAHDLSRVRVAISRLHTIVQAQAGKHDPIPSLAELLSERRDAQTE